MTTIVEDVLPGFEELAPPLDEAEALVEADRCLECGVRHANAPCLVACPAGVDVPAFVAAIARADHEEAARFIFRENLLGGTCARVCPVEELCVGACVLPHDGGRPIAIGRLQRFAADAALAADLPLRERLPYNWHDVAVIGAGPAGLACAGELGARGYHVTVFDERREPGGLARYAIAPYRQVREPLPAEARLLMELGVSLELGLGVDSREALAQLEADFDAIVLACGMGDDAESGCPGSELDGVWRSLPFIERIKTGEPPAVGRSVAVVGGGNTAVDVAREAIRLGASDVTMLYRRTRDEMPAYPHEVAEAEAEGVRFSWLTIPVRYVGDERLVAVECRRAQLGEPDASGRRRPQEVPGSEFLLRVDTVVEAIGQRPRADFLGWIDGLELDGGRIAVDPETGRTGNPKYFAAGDAVNGGATVVEAVRSAKVVAGAIDGWLGSLA
jgi:dihydropyrimidine dehydrogenase (NAD+) subunit PreT